MLRNGDHWRHIEINGDALLDVWPPDCPAPVNGFQCKRQFEEAVSQMLSTLWEKSGTGRALLLTIGDTAKRTHTRLRIVPFTPAEQMMSPAGWRAYTLAADPRKAAPRAARLAPEPDDDDREERFGRRQETGTGEGSDAEIHYDPFGFELGVNRFAALVHELVHAVREMSGLLDPIPTERLLESYHNEEDYFATLVENIYRSEALSRLLLGFDGQMVPEDLGMSVGLLKDATDGLPHRRLVSKLVTQMTGLCRNIRNHVPVGVAFNPIREFMHDGSRDTAKK
jgi:hypothetical protein